MSRENVEVVRRMFNAFRNADWPAALEPVHLDIEMDTTRLPLAGLSRTYRGLAEVTGFWREWLDAWGGQEFEDPEFIDAGDRVVMWTGGHQLRGRSSGIKLKAPPYGWVATVRNGQLVRATVYTDRTEALEAAGLSE
jgi:ketosteroid isomerase-like protein